jgi:hypothetical protein
MKTLLATILVAFVGCHGNPVYRAVTWIPICVSVTWSPVFPTCERFPWEAPTGGWHLVRMTCLNRRVVLHWKHTMVHLLSF